MELDFFNEKLKLKVSVILAGGDVSICIHGGDKPHIGCTALAVPHPGICEKDKKSSTVSVINVTGHRDGSAAEYCAKRISGELKCVAAVSCGIHYNDFNINVKNELFEYLDELCKEIITKIQN